MDIQKVIGVNLVPTKPLEVSASYGKEMNTISDEENVLKRINKETMPEGLKGLKIDTTA